MSMARRIRSPVAERRGCSSQEPEGELIAREQPAVFCSLLARILPHELATSGGPLKQEILLRWMSPEMAKARGYENPTEEETETETPNSN